MNSVVITKIGKCFDIAYNYSKGDAINNLFAVLDIDYVGKYAGISKDGTLSLLFNEEHSPSSGFKTKNYKFSKRMTGSYWHKDGFGKVFEAGCLVKDRNSNISHMCYFSGGDFTNSWCSESIANGFVNFLNKLVQFESLEDYITYEEVHKDEEWGNKDVCDKILELAKVIELYKKYHEINRALSITHEMEDLINRRIKFLLKDKNES